MSENKQEHSDNEINIHSNGFPSKYEHHDVVHTMEGHVDLHVTSHDNRIHHPTSVWFVWVARLWWTFPVALIFLIQGLGCLVIRQIIAARAASEAQ